LLYHSAYEDKLNGKVPTYYLGSVKAHFFHSVVPGNELRIESETVRLFPGGGLTKTKAYVKTTGVAEAELVFIVK
jgi:3-hydroxymyristoyl/3-hydroxydecanoyl-(acyl carrier protein) dehydratase